MDESSHARVALQVIWLVRKSRANEMEVVKNSSPLGYVHDCCGGSSFSSRSKASASHALWKDEGGDARRTVKAAKSEKSGVARGNEACGGIHAWSLRRRRRTFFRRDTGDVVNEKSESVSLEAMLWYGERRSERLLSKEDFTIDPACSGNITLSGRYAELERVLEDPGGRDAFENFLDSGGCLPALCLWLVLERFRTCGCINDESDNASSREDKKSQGNRRAARLIYDIFCHDTAPLCVPLGEDVRTRLDKVLWGTPDHIDTGRTVFIAAQSKVMVELERGLLMPFLRSKAYQVHSANECVAVIPHASLVEVLASDDARSVFVAYLHIEQEQALSFCSHAHVRQAGLPSQLVAFYDTVGALHRVNGTLQVKRGQDIIRTFLEKGQAAMVRNLLGKTEDEVEAAVNELRKTLDFGPLFEKAFFKLRDDYFSTFTQTTSYLRCLSIVSKVPLDKLHHCVEQLGKPFKPNSKASRKTNQQMHNSSSVENELKFAESNSKKLHRIATRLRKGGYKVGLAPGLSNREMMTQSKVNASPRDWKRALRQPCCEPHMTSYVRDIPNISIAGNPGQLKKICLGLEGVFRNSGLRTQFVLFARKELCGNDHEANDLGELLRFVVSMQRFEGKWANKCKEEDNGMQELVETPLSDKNSGLKVLLQPYVSVEACRDAIASDPASALGELNKLRFAAVNMLLRKYLPSFMAVRKLDQRLFPGILDMVICNDEQA